MSAQNPNLLPPFPDRKKINIQTLRQKKLRRQMISMLTAYDFPTAQAMEPAQIDAILVGDSLGVVVLGHENTLPVTMEDMLHHYKAVAHGAHFARLVGDMPLLSYQVSVSDAVRNAGRILQEAGMDAVKLEGGHERVETIRSIVAGGIPVMGDMGLIPQSIHQLGSFVPQARQAQAAKRLLQDAQALQAAGCFALVLESLPARLAALVSQSLEIPTIGIGDGPGCDGQLLVVHDMLGLFERFTPRFVQKYAGLAETMRQAFSAYIDDIEAGRFPAAEHSVEMNEEEWQTLSQLLQSAS